MGGFIGNLFGANTPQEAMYNTVASTIPPPSVDSGEVSRAAAEERKRRSLAQGRGSTMIASAESQTEEPTLARKKLLGS